MLCLGGHPAAPQGEVHVIPEPGGQGDVPPPPELGDRPGDVGVVEVLQEVEAEHLAQADGHVGVAGEVIVDLEGVADGAQPGKGGGEVPRPLQQEGPVGHQGQLVGDEHLLPQSGDEPGAAGGEVVPGLLPVVDLVGHRLILDDGAGDELGEEGDVQPHLQGGALHMAPAPLHVQHVAQGLEGEEGDTDGQLNARDHKGSTQPIQNTQRKSKVFKYEQDTQIEQNRHQHRHFRTRAGGLAVGHPQAEAVIDHDGEHHHQHEPGLSPGVEHQGGQQQEDVLGLPPAPQKQIVDDEHSGQEQEQKD